MDKTLLSIIELGGYPNFIPLYQSRGLTVESVNSVRKAIKVLKTSRPAIIVSEFNFQSDFRDRTSSLESLLAAVQWMPETKVIVLYDKEWHEKLQQLLAVYTVFATIPFPIKEQQLASVLDRAIVVD